MTEVGCELTLSAMIAEDVVCKVMPRGITHPGRSLTESRPGEGSVCQHNTQPGLLCVSTEVGILIITLHFGFHFTFLL